MKRFIQVQLDGMYVNACIGLCMGACMFMKTDCVKVCMCMYIRVYMYVHENKLCHDSLSAAGWYVCECMYRSMYVCM